MNRARILMISGNAPPVIDGVGHYTGNLLETLRALRPQWEWKWFCRRPRWWSSPFVSYRGIPSIRPIHAWNEIGKALVATAIRLAKPDLIHIQDQIHSYHETDAAVRMAKAVRSPVVVTLHEFHIELPSVRYTIALVNQSAAVVANDRRNSERCHACTGRTPDYRWWSPSNVRPPDPSWGVQPVRGMVTTFGQISRIKALDVVHAGLVCLHSKRPELRWRIIGPFKPEKNPQHSAVAQQIKEPWVNFTGEITDLHDRRLRTLLGESQAMLLPFGDGASPRRCSLQAAWAFGLPVITTPPPVEEPDIIDGENCILVRDCAPRAWAAAIDRVLGDSRLGERLRAGSLATAERFSWKRLAGLHLKLYERILKNRPPRRIR